MVRSCLIACLMSVGLSVLALSSAWGGDWPWKKATPGEPNTLEEVARSIDCLEDKILDDGTVVIKKPDVYGQSRMTLYRKDFERQMYGAIGKFNVVASARVFRSDQAAFASQTNLAAGLASASSKAKTTTATTTNVVTPPPVLPAATGGGITPDGLAPNSIVRPNTITAALGSTPFTFGGTGANTVGLEPTVYLDELKNFQDHLNEIRRINMGDDTADSAGYGLYLLRMPISIQPGECTKSGYGAILNATVRHDFDPDFLPSTFRNLAINDLVDQLAPVVFETIRSKALDQLPNDARTPEGAEEHYRKVLKITGPVESLDLYAIFIRDLDEANISPFYREIMKDKSYKSFEPYEVDRRTAGSRAPFQEPFQTTSLSAPFTRMNDRNFPIPPTEFANVFLEQNIVLLALNARKAMQTVTPKSTDVRAFLRREIEAAYDIISQIYGSNDEGSSEIVSGFEASVEAIAKHVRTQDYYAIYRDYHDLARVLPGQLQYKWKDDTTGNPLPIRDPNASLIDPITILCYSIAVEAGLLDQQLRVDMKRVFGKEGGDCSDVDAMRFYRPQPEPAAVEKFQEYIRRRWPLITFALYPMVDQQNIDDVNSTSRDLQLALAFAFSSGQINFQQLLQFQRKVVTEAEAVALNRTVTTFSHGDDTFGYRFTPRYQNAPPEKSNFAVLANTLIKGGQGRNYRIKNSQLEAGQHELNAVVIMPSFLQGIQMDVTGNWFPLHDPDQMKIPTPRMIEQGHKVVELQEALHCIHEHKTYRRGDIQRLTTRVHQLEAMLPMQTQEIRVPYENTIGGFQLFQRGVTSLVPQLDGFQGVDAIQDGQDVDLIIFGKHFSIQETSIVVGGQYLPLPTLDPTTGAPTASAPAAPATSAPAAGGASAAAGGTATASPSNPATIDVVSREVMRIHIPAGLLPTSVFDADQKAKQTYVELYVATPNGISNRLLIPFVPNPTTPPSPAVGFNLGADAVNVGFLGSVQRDAAGNVYFSRDFEFDPTLSDKDPLTLTVESPHGFVPKSIAVDFQATFDGATMPVDFKLPRNVAIDPTDGTCKIEMKDLAQALLSNPTAFAQIIRDLAKNPSVTTTVLLTPVITHPDFAAVQRKANSSLTVTVKLNNLPAVVGAIPLIAPPLSGQAAPGGAAPGASPQLPTPNAPQMAPGDVPPPPTPTPFAPATPGAPPAHAPDGTPLPKPPPPSPVSPGASSTRAPRAIPIRDANLKPSAYRPAAGSPNALPPLPPSAMKPAASKANANPRPSMGHGSTPATKTAARKAAAPAVSPTPAQPKVDPVDKGGKKPWPWQRP